MCYALYTYQVLSTFSILLIKLKRAFSMPFTTPQYKNVTVFLKVCHA